MPIDFSQLNISLSVENLAILIFVLASLVGTWFAYYAKWSWENIPLPLFKYMFGDKHAFGRVITTLAVLCGSTSGLELLSSMTNLQIIMSGIGLGLMVPSVVSKKLEEHHITPRGSNDLKERIRNDNPTKSAVVTNRVEES